MAKYDQDAVRDKKKDYELLPSNMLHYILKSKIPNRDKKKLLLSQIGLLRINLFMEHSQRVEMLEDNNQLNEAVEVMNDYVVNIAIPFIPVTKKPSLINRFMDLISRERLLEPFEYVQKWKTEYHSWVESSEFPKNELLRPEKFAQLQTIFRMLYAMSFSDDNFPPSPTIVLFDPSRVKI